VPRWAVGAVIAGRLAQSFGLNAAVIAGGALTFASALLAARWISDGTWPARQSDGNAGVQRPASLTSGG